MAFHNGQHNSKPPKPSREPMGGFKDLSNDGGFNQNYYHLYPNTYDDYSYQAPYPVAPGRPKRQLSKMQNFAPYQGRGMNVDQNGSSYHENHSSFVPDARQKPSRNPMTIQLWE